MSETNISKRENNIVFLKSISELKTGVSPEFIEVIKNTEMSDLDGTVMLWAHGCLTFSEAILNKEEKKEEFDKFEYAEKFVATHKIVWDKRLKFAVEEGEDIDYPYQTSIYASTAFISKHILDIEEQLEIPEMIKGLTKDERYTLLLILIGNLTLNEFGEEQLAKIFNKVNVEMEHKDIDTSLLIIHSLAIRWLIRSL